MIYLYIINYNSRGFSQPMEDTKKSSNYIIQRDVKNSLVAKMPHFVGDKSNRPRAFAEDLITETPTVVPVRTLADENVTWPAHFRYCPTLTTVRMSLWQRLCASKMELNSNVSGKLSSFRDQNSTLLTLNITKSGMGP